MVPSQNSVIDTTECQQAAFANRLNIGFLLSIGLPARSQYGDSYIITNFEKTESAVESRRSATASSSIAKGGFSVDCSAMLIINSALTISAAGSHQGGVSWKSSNG